MIPFMNTRSFSFVFAAFILLTISSQAAEIDFSIFKLDREPVIRVGLTTNASSVVVTTTDSSLVAFSPDEPQRFLNANRVSVSARSYRPPEIEIYHFEIRNLENQTEAQALAKELSAAIGENAVPSIDSNTSSWRVIVGRTFDTIEEAGAFRSELSEKGYEAELITEKITQASDEAIQLSNQVANNPKSKVRSILPTRPGIDQNKVKPIVSSLPLVADIANANLREVIVSGASDAAKFSSLKAVAFGSASERSVPVRVNGKEYRGRIEVFVNARGTLTVVNAVSLEDYLLGVVPNELSLPQLEAQKAQAVAARTYAIANANGFGSQGFDVLPTVRSQVYNGYSSESPMGTQAVMQTRGIVAMYKGKPITAYYTSTCGGRTENSENVFDSAEPYLRGVECSLEGRRHFEPFTIKTVRVPAKLRDEKNLGLVRLMALLAVNGFQLSTAQMSDDFFEDAPTSGELSNWLNQIATKFGKPFPNVTKDSSKPLELARVLSTIIYGDAYADTLLSDADVNYQISFDDAAEIPPARRADVAILLRDGYFTLYPDLTLKPNKPFSRAKTLRLIQQIYAKKKWMPNLQSGTAQASSDGKLMIKNGKTSRQLFVRPDVFLFREFGDAFYQVKETALVGGETVNFQTDASGAVIYLEVEPTTGTATAEKDSSFTLWNTTLSPSAMHSRLSRYVRGIGTLIDVRVVKQGYSRRTTDLEIVGTNGTFHLKGGKIRSALRLNEQLFALNKRYDSNGRATSYSFTGRGWGHGIGMCQYGAYGLAKMGVKYDEILKHYYTGIDLTKAY